MREPRYRVLSIGFDKWYVVEDTSGNYLHLDGTLRSMDAAKHVLFKSEELAREALSNHIKVIRIGGE